MRLSLRLPLRHFAALAACLAVLSPGALSAAPSITYTTVDYPGAATTTGVGSINDRDEFVGYYDDAQAHFHGFSGRKGSTRYTPIDFPGATQTYLLRINNWGEMVGTYFDAQGYQHGFVRIPALWPGSSPVFIPFDFPGAAQTQGIAYELGTGLGTSSFGLNDWGQVTGQYADGDGVGHGFILSYDGFTSYTAPGSSSSPGFYGGSALSDINDFDDLSGEYADNAGKVRGFLASRGKFTPIDPPGSIGTELFGINNSREVCGFYYDAQIIGHGYIYNKGKYLIVDVPGAVYISTVATINNSGEFVGEYLDGQGLTHGYVATRH